MMWYSQYVGQPYERANCWEFVRQVYREQLNMQLQPLAAEVDMRDWTINRSPEMFDVLVFQRGKQRHVGIALTHGMMLHSCKDIGAVVIEPYNTPVWKWQWKWACRHKNR